MNKLKELHSVALKVSY